MNFIKCLKFLYILTVLCLRHNFTHNKCWYTVHDYRFETIKKLPSFVATSWPAPKVLTPKAPAADLNTSLSGVINESLV